MIELTGQLKNVPIIAILRGITPAEGHDVGVALVEAGIVTIEVPLNSPNALDTIAALRHHLPAHVVVGAGTVLTIREVADVVAAGADFIVSPNVDRDVIDAAHRHDRTAIPGAATPTEILLAGRAGCGLVKVFPFESLGLTFLTAVLAILPTTIGLVPVGGVGTKDVGPVLMAGAAAIGTGGFLYKAGLTAEDVGTRASALIRQLPNNALHAYNSED